MKICDVAFSPYTLRIPPSYALIKSSRNTEKKYIKYWTKKYEENYVHFNGLKVKRCFERVVYHFTLFGLKHEKKNQIFEENRFVFEL